MCSLCHCFLHHLMHIVSYSMLSMQTLGVVAEISSCWHVGQMSVCVYGGVCDPTRDILSVEYVFI